MTVYDIAIYAVFYLGIECYGTRRETYEEAYQAGVAAGYGDKLAEGTACVLEA